MDGRLIRTNCDEAGDHVVPYVLGPRDLVSRPDNMDETILSSSYYRRQIESTQFFCLYAHTPFYLEFGQLLKLSKVIQFEYQYVLQLRHV